MTPNNAPGKGSTESPARFPFHYGDEAEQYTFYRIPKQMFLDPVIRDISTDAKLLYGLMLDRMSLSAKNGWFDGGGRVYIYFSVEEIMETLCCGNGKSAKLLAELDDKSGIGLITRVRQGQGKPGIIYVHKCIGEMSNSHVKRCENRTLIILKRIIQILVITIESFQKRAARQRASRSVKAIGN